MDPIRNPYAPGAGQRPPELAGRDEQLAAFDVVLERVSRGRPERSLVLTGLRGVGKTVLLNALRGAAVRRQWGTGKLEARPDQGLRRPLSGALHQAVRELGHRDADSVDHVLGVIKAFAQRDAGPAAKMRDQWSPGIDAPAVRGRADSGDIEIDLVELFTDLGGLAADKGKGIAIFIDEMQDLGPDDVSALCAACHEISQSGLPVIVVGAGLPHLPGGAVGQQVLLRAALPLPAHRPAHPRGGGPRAHRAGRGRGRRSTRRVRSRRCTPRRAATPTSSRPTARPSGTARPARRSPRPTSRWPPPRPTPSSRSASSAAATSGPRRGSATTCGRWPTWPAPSRTPPTPVPTADVAAALGKKPQSLSPARDSLLKKGLIYSGERGRIAFTVPHFGRYLREHAN